MVATVNRFQIGYGMFWREINGDVTWQWFNVMVQKSYNGVDHRKKVKTKCNRRSNVQAHRTTPWHEQIASITAGLANRLTLLFILIVAQKSLHGVIEINDFDFDFGTTLTL